MERLQENLASPLQVNRILDFSILYVEQKQSGRGLGTAPKTDTVDQEIHPYVTNRTAGRAVSMYLCCVKMIAGDLILN